MKSSIPIVAGLIVGTIVLVFVLALLYRFYKFLFQNKVIFGGSLKTRIVALGITSLFFSHGIYLIFFHPLRILFDALPFVYNTLREISQNNDVSKELSSIVSRLFSSLSELLIGWFQQFDPGSIIMSLAAWSLIAQLIDSYQRTEMQETEKTVNTTFRQNVILVLVFVLSIYLSLAAIITVPYFTENKEKESSDESLRAQLVKIKESNEKKIVALTISDEPKLAVDTTLIIEVNKIPNLRLRAKMNSEITAWTDNSLSNLNTRRDITDHLNEQKLTLKSKMDDEMDKVLKKYAADGLNLKSQLKKSFISTLIEYYEKIPYEYFREGDGLKSAVEFEDERLKRDLFTFKQNTRYYIQLAVKTDTTNSSEIERLESMDFGIGQQNYYSGLNRFYSDEYQAYLPMVPTPGDELGIFKDIAQWLIKPNSMALVLIVGMLGFGLFGAVISTFVKEAKERNENTNGAIIKDITGVIIRGISAAIVIFLGVKGGLAIFSSGEGEPNPYALFFTCLIGAVYSERIWEWAKEKLTDSLGNKNKTAAAAAKPESALDGNE